MSYPIMRTSRLHRTDTKLLLLDQKEIGHYQLSDLPYLLPKDSVLVVNNASTIPASLWGLTSVNRAVEIRLSSLVGSDYSEIRFWNAIAFGNGSWKQDTTERDEPPLLRLGDVLKFGSLNAKITAISQVSNRWIQLQFLGEMQDIWQQLYENGKPIQYSHLLEELEIWDVQTIFSSIPVSVEPASASFQFTWSLVDKIEQLGMEIIPITHATTLSSTGDKKLDAQLPFPENYWISDASAYLLNEALMDNKRIIGIGTSVTRALESEYLKHGRITAGHGRTDLVITRDHRRNVVSDLFTGMHLLSASHIKLLSSFINPKELERAYRKAIRKGYYWHEYGDVSLVLTNRE